MHFQRNMRMRRLTTQLALTAGLVLWSSATKTWAGNSPCDCSSCEVIWTLPPNGAIDARIPHECGHPESLLGIDTIRVHAPDGANSVISWALCETPETGTTNTIFEIEDLGGGDLILHLARPITQGKITTITYECDQESGVYTSQPADVNGDGISDADDVVALMDILNGSVEPPFESLSTDIDHSGETTPADILTTIDLLNGAGNYVAWSTFTMPPQDGCPLNRAPTGRLLSPCDGCTTTDTTPTFIWEYDDPDGDPVSVTFYLDDDSTPLTDPLLTVPVGADTQYTIPSENALPVGNFSWTITITDDGLGNLIISDGDWGLEILPPVNSSPTGELISPSNGSAIEDTTPMFEWAANDSDGDAVSSTLFVAPCNSPFSNPFSNPLHIYPLNPVTISHRTFTIPSEDALPEGNYIWGVRLDDGVTPSVEIPDSKPGWMLEILPPQNSCPTATLESPCNGCSTTGTPTFEWTTNDADEDTVSVTLVVDDDNLPFDSPLRSFPMETATSFKVPTNFALPPGSYWWGIRLFDSACGSFVNIPPSGSERFFEVIP